MTFVDILGTAPSHQDLFLHPHSVENLSTTVELALLLSHHPQKIVCTRTCQRRSPTNVLKPLADSERGTERLLHPFANLLFSSTCHQNKSRRKLALPPALEGENDSRVKALVRKLQLLIEFDPQSEMDLFEPIRNLTKDEGEQIPSNENCRNIGTMFRTGHRYYQSENIWIVFV